VILNKYRIILFFVFVPVIIIGSTQTKTIGLVSDKDFYTILEYGVISEEQDCFVMNQPYNYQTSVDILTQVELNEWLELLITRFAYNKPDDEQRESIGIKFSPGILRSSIGGL
jgi:hypothetical protein